MTPSLLTPDEVCALLRIERKQLTRWVRLKRIPAVWLNDRVMRFDADVVDQFLADRMNGEQAS